MHSKKTLGVIRNRTRQLDLNRSSYLKRKLSDGRKDNESSLSDNGKTSLLGKKSPSSLPMIEMKDISMPSSYIDLFNSTNSLYEELTANLTQLQSEQQKRILPKFDEEENSSIDQRIRELVLSMTQKVKQCELNVKSLDRASLTSNESVSIKENIKNYLAERLRDFTRVFQKNEKSYLANYKDLIGESSAERLDDDNEHSKISPNYFQVTEESNAILKKRDEEIDILLTSITQLSTVFKDLQSLVQNQGTILDRIDYNIDTALDKSVDAHKHLVNANAEMKKSCFRNVLLIMLIVLFVEAVLMLFKFIN